MSIPYPFSLPGNRLEKMSGDLERYSEVRDENICFRRYSRQEALNNIKDAAEIYIEDMIDAKEALPTPSGEIELREEPAIAVSL